MTPWCGVVYRGDMTEEKFLPNVRIDPILHAALKRLAKANERTLAAEIRVAVRKHVDASELKGEA